VFNDQQKTKVERYSVLYVIAFFCPFFLKAISTEWTVLGGIVIWLLASMAYLFSYRRVVSELPKSDRFFVTWGVSTYFPQVLFKAALFFAVVMLWLLGSVVYDVFIS